MVERKFKEGYSAPELKELEKELDKKAEEWYSLDEVTDSARKKRLWNDIFTLAVCRYNIPDKKKDKNGEDTCILESIYLEAIVYCLKSYDPAKGSLSHLLSVTTAIALSDEFDTDVRYCSNRKEVKDHGDVGILLGGPINDGDRVMMIEDVTTSGKSINETMPIIQAQGNVTVTGLCVSVDRMERGTGEKSAIAELEEKFGIRIRAIVTMQEVIEHLYNKPYKGKIIIDDTIKAAIDEYYKQYGAK